MINGLGCKDTKKIPHTQAYAGFFLIYAYFYRKYDYYNAISLPDLMISLPEMVNE
jgi:hypothetical protein